MSCLSFLPWFFFFFLLRPTFPWRMTLFPTQCCLGGTLNEDVLPHSFFLPPQPSQAHDVVRALLQVVKLPPVMKIRESLLFFWVMPISKHKCPTIYSSPSLLKALPSLFQQSWAQTEFCPLSLIAIVVKKVFLACLILSCAMFTVTLGSSHILFPLGIWILNRVMKGHKSCRNEISQWQQLEDTALVLSP